MIDIARLFVGYDEREAACYAVFCHSVRKRSSIPVSFQPIDVNTLAKIYGSGLEDGSNRFTYRRFLIPYLCDFKGWALWADGDMLCRADIADLWVQRDSTYAVQVVAHAYRTHYPIKYLGAKNEDYPRKQWSSLMLVNAGHKAWQGMTPAAVKARGSALHRFPFIDDAHIGTLLPEWNWLAMELPFNKDAKIVHFTIGAPVFKEYATVDYADEWHQEAKEVLSCASER